MPLERVWSRQLRKKLGRMSGKGQMRSEYDALRKRLRWATLRGDTDKVQRLRAAIEDWKTRKHQTVSR